MRLAFQELHDYSQAWGLYISQAEREICALSGFLASLRPHHVMEIGTAFGGTFLLLCHTSTGKKISVDMVNGPFSMVFSENGQETVMDPGHRERIGQISPLVTLVDGDSTAQETVQRVHDALGSEKVDFLFIDGDHSAEGSWRDYQNYAPFVKRGGWIGFHDIVDSERHRQAGCYVCQTWAKVKSKHKIWVEFLSGEDWAGIGLAQKE